MSQIVPKGFTHECFHSRLRSPQKFNSVCLYVCHTIILFNICHLSIPIHSNLEKNQQQPAQGQPEGQRLQEEKRRLEMVKKQASELNGSWAKFTCLFDARILLWTLAILKQERDGNQRLDAILQALADDLFIVLQTHPVRFGFGRYESKWWRSGST